MNPSGQSQSLSIYAEISRKVADQKEWPRHETPAPHSKGKATPAQDATRFVDWAAPEQEGVDLTGKVGSAPAAPPALGPPSPGPGPPRVCPLRLPEPTQQPPGSRAGTLPSQSLLGAVALRPPDNPARQATPSEEELRLPRASPYTAILHAPPQSMQPSPHPSSESRPSNTSFTLWPSSQDRAPQPYPDSKKHTPGNKTSASSRLGDSDLRQHVHDTFAIAVKGYRVRTSGGAGALLGEVSAPRAPPGCSGARPGAPPHVRPSGRLRTRPPALAGSSMQGRPERGRGLASVRSEGVCLRMPSGGSGKWTQPGALHPRGGRASRVLARLVSRGHTVRGTGKGPGGGWSCRQAPGSPGAGGPRLTFRSPSLVSSPSSPATPVPKAGPSSASPIFSRPQAKRSRDLGRSASLLGKEAAV